MYKNASVTAKEDGFVITYKSKEDCTTNFLQKARKFTFQIIGKCNKNVEPASMLTAMQEGTGLSEVISCAQTMRFETPDACDFFVYG
jgi:hypothetical protein